jgi:hypothetical protein
MQNKIKVKKLFISYKENILYLFEIFKSSLKNVLTFNKEKRFTTKLK